MRKYELWLDESGDFEPDSQTRKTRFPSMVGGVLIPKECLSDDEIRRLANPAHNADAPHAVNMKDQVESVILPALETLCARGGKLVYFENRERVRHLNNRELYCRVLAAGLLQLTQYLSAAGSFALDAFVAVRYAPEGGVLRQITPAEYRDELSAYVRRAYADAGFHLSPDSHIYLSVLSARKESRLFLADYACNSRMTRNSKKFNASMRQRLERLFDSRYIWTVNARTSESYILSRLGGGDVSGALLELYTGYGRTDRPKMLRRILDRLQGMSYRLARLHLRRFSAALQAFAGQETDFERCEAVLKLVLDEFFPALEEREMQLPAAESAFWVLLSLADMYLREGDVIHAAPVMRDLEMTLRRMDGRMESLRHLYFYLDKKALFEINRMEYAAAVRTMSGTIRCMENAMDALSCDPLIRQWYGGKGAAFSEYLGDAYCMKVYAELFLQRQEPELYENSLRADTEKALSQYRAPEELERNLQYRAHAEMERGNCAEALEWLLKTRRIAIRDGNVIGACVAYLKAARTEDKLSKTYYVMYYTEIMEKAAQTGDTALAKQLHDALKREGEILREIVLERPPESGIVSDTGKPPVIYDDIFQNPADKIRRRYHPLEVVFWKYGSYLFRAGQRSAASAYWDKALSVCDENPDYAAIKLVALAIQLERFSFLRGGGLKSGAVRRNLERRAADILRTPELPPVMTAYAQSVQDFAKAAQRPDSATAEAAYRLSRRIAY